MSAKASADALIEIGTEELPPKALRGLSEAFVEGIRARLAQTRLAFGAVTGYAAPRRLAVHVASLALAEPDHETQRRGPALAAAFDTAGAPTPAALGFARSCGVAIEALARLETAQGAWLVHTLSERGRPAAAMLPGVVSGALDRLPIPRRMRWGAGVAEFVRPVHWIVLLHGEDVVPAEILGVATGRTTRGHRFHHPAAIELPRPDAYLPLLEKAHVLADFVTRRERIRAGVEATARNAGGTPLFDDALLDEVTSLTEWPVVLTAAFDAEYLRLPREVLVATMQGHQRYFPLAAPDGTLLPQFITVANVESREPGRIREGNARVVRPRLADAAFFWDQDRRQPLADRLESLGSVVYQERLGTLRDKTLRVEMLAAAIAGAIGADAGATARAARLSRCDLMTALVGEFPELQGTMGRYYALAAGEPAEVAQAIDELYLPRHAGDRLPATGAGRALAIADRLDTLAGIFGIGQLPTGDRDPYGLRRAALGVLRTIIEGGLDLDLAPLLESAATGYGERLPDPAASTAQVLDFVIERLRGHYADQGIAPDTFEAVAAVRPTRPLDFDRRLKAVQAFRALPEAESLAAANKRIANILRKSEAAPVARVYEALLEAGAERALHEALQAHAAGDAGADHAATLARLAALRGPVDAFFDQVLVNCEDAAVRANRLALLSDLSAQFLRIADISRLQS